MAPAFCSKNRGQLSRFAYIAIQARNLMLVANPDA
jgi:hypothetical protein